MAYIYRHIRPDKNEPFYIGISKKEDNYGRAKSTYRRNKIWWDIVNKNNGVYKVQILMDNLSLEEVLEKEMEFIKLYGRINLSSGILSNLSNGGEKNEGIIHTKETIENMKKAAKLRIEKDGAKEKISIATKKAMENPSIKDKIRESNKNRVYTQEWRDNIGKAHKGKIHSEDTISKMKISAEKRGDEFRVNNYFSKVIKLKHLIDQNTNEIYPSIASIAKTFGICRKKLKKDIDKGISNFKYTDEKLKREDIYKFLDVLKIKIS